MKERSKATGCLRTMDDVYISDDIGYKGGNKVGKSLRKAGNSSECPFTAVMGKGRRWKN